VGGVKMLIRISNIKRKRQMSIKKELLEYKTVCLRAKKAIKVTI
jgi:hypothetical protein